MNEREVRAWMILRGLRVKDVAAANGVTCTAVYKFLHGRMSSQRMRLWFRRRGCPAEHLGVVKPEKGRRAA